MKLIPAGNLESADPVMAVRWCVERSEAEELRERRAESIHILFVIAYEGTTLEDRQLVPIDQVMTYLNFRRPGKHTVFAKVVWPAGNDNAAKLECLVEKVSHRNYDWQVLNDERTDFREISKIFGWRVKSLRESAELEVTIPKDHFPAEPPEWLKRLANSGYTYPPVDQCDFRHRKLVLLPKLLAFGFWAVMTTIIRAAIAAFLGLRGMRNINFAAVVHPWRDDIEDVSLRVHMEGDSCWFEETKDGHLRSTWIYLCHPSVYLVLFAVLTCFKVYYHKSYLALAMIVAMAIANSAIFIGTWLMHVFSRFWVIVVFSAVTPVIAIKLARALGTARKNAEAKRREREATLEFRERREREKEQAYDDLYRLLACRPNLMPMLSAIPPERRTIRLRYLNLKAKVCRPFAAS